MWFLFIFQGLLVWLISYFPLLKAQFTAFFQGLLTQQEQSKNLIFFLALAEIVMFVRPLMYLVCLLNALSVQLKFSVLILNKFVIASFLFFLKRILWTKTNISVGADHVARDIVRLQWAIFYVMLILLYFLIIYLGQNRSSIAIWHAIICFSVYFFFPVVNATNWFEPTTFVLSKITKKGILFCQVTWSFVAILLSEAIIAS